MATRVTSAARWVRSWVLIPDLETCSESSHPRNPHMKLAKSHLLCSSLARPTPRFDLLAGVLGSVLALTACGTEPATVSGIGNVMGNGNGDGDGDGLTGGDGDEGGEG